MNRRALITLLGGVAAASPLSWALTARAQQPAKETAMPMVGVLYVRGPGDDPHLASAFRNGLRDAGYVEGQNLTLEHRFAGGRYDRLPGLAAELVQRRVSVIAALGSPAAPAAKAATTTIPVVFTVGVDPVEAGLVASMNRPGGNLTGATGLGVELGPKRLEVLRELVPASASIAALINPSTSSAARQEKDLQSAASALGVQLHVLPARTEGDLEAAFAALAQLRAGALVIANDPFFISRNEHLAALTLRHAVPAISQVREFATAGGLLSYGTSLTELYRLAGVYTGRILKGERPSELPVQQSTKVELIVNLKTAKAFGLTVPLSLLGRADEVIE